PGFPGPAELAATTELSLPVGAQLVGATLQRGRGKPEAALAVDAGASYDRVTPGGVLGSDPLAIAALPPRADRARYRVIVQPIEPEQEVVIVTQWTATATIRDGALQLRIPGRGDGVTPA